MKDVTTMLYSDYGVIPADSDGTMGSVARKQERFQTMYKRLKYELDTWK